jgi:hypothetical protein
MSSVVQPAEAVSPSSSPTWSSPPPVVLVRRARRVGFGQGLVLGGVGTIAAWVLAELAPGRIPDNVAFVGIGMTWLLAFALAAVAGVVVRSAAAREVIGDDGLGRASFVLPALGLSLVGPISLHALVGVVPALLGENVDGWLVFAFGGTMHAHFVFALAMVSDAFLVAGDGKYRRVVLWPAVFISLAPGALLVFPPVLVWMCGLIVSRAFMRLAVRWYRVDHTVAEHSGG